MLQQTQANRVVAKYPSFLKKFPTLESLAMASLGEVIVAWQGLGYNRRAKYIHEAAKFLQNKTQPWQYRDLVSLKGIGPNTAAAICVYSYNEPRIFIETNVRTVFIYHFFSQAGLVNDKAITALLADCLKQQENPREFYWALMDYGTHLKTTKQNYSRQSAHYKRQTPFHGSQRQLRGSILRALQEKPLTKTELMEQFNDMRLKTVLKQLVMEGLVQEKNHTYRLPA